MIFLFLSFFFFFFFNDTATTEIYTLSLHDALPIDRRRPLAGCRDTRRFPCHGVALDSASPSPILAEPGRLRPFAFPGGGAGDTAPGLSALRHGPACLRGRPVRPDRGNHRAGDSHSAF